MNLSAARGNNINRRGIFDLTFTKVFKGSALKSINSRVKLRLLIMMMICYTPMLA